jgi:hypothetical protein
MTDNVVSFPKERIVAVRNDPEEFKEKLVDHKMAFCENVLYDYMAELYGKLQSSEIEVESEEFQIDYTFVVDALRAALYKSVGLSHPLHPLISKYVEENYTEEDILPLVEDE